MVYALEVMVDVRLNSIYLLFLPNLEVIQPSCKRLAGLVYALILATSVRVHNKAPIKYRLYHVDDHMLDNSIIKGKRHYKPFLRFKYFEYEVLTGGIGSVLKVLYGPEKVYLPVRLKL